jgi:hypothetical protein
MEGGGGYTTYNRVNNGFCKHQHHTSHYHHRPKENAVFNMAVTTSADTHTFPTRLLQAGGMSHNQTASTVRLLKASTTGGEADRQWKITQTTLPPNYAFSTCNIRNKVTPVTGCGGL